MSWKITVSLQGHGSFTCADIHLIRYLLSDGDCYALKIHSDRALLVDFSRSLDTFISRSSGARVVKPAFLLNCKAYSYRNSESADQKAEDVDDIEFLLSYLSRDDGRVSRGDCRWVVDYQFWTEFTRDRPRQAPVLASLGLTRDPAPGLITSPIPMLRTVRQSSCRSGSSVSSGSSGSSGGSVRSNPTPATARLGSSSNIRFNPIPATARRGRSGSIRSNP